MTNDNLSVYVIGSLRRVCCSMPSIKGFRRIMHSRNATRNTASTTTSSRFLCIIGESPMCKSRASVSLLGRSCCLSAPFCRQNRKLTLWRNEYRTRCFRHAIPRFDSTKPFRLLLMPGGIMQRPLCSWSYAFDETGTSWLFHDARIESGQLTTVLWGFPAHERVA